MRSIPFIFLLLLTVTLCPAGSMAAPERVPKAASLEASGEKLQAPDDFPLPERIDDREVIRAFSDSLVQQQRGAPVTVNNHELFRLYDTIGDITLERRAEKTSERLNDFFRSRIPIDSLSIVEGHKLTAIRTPDNIITAFSDLDAIAQQLTRRELAEEAFGTIALQTGKFREETSGRNILFSLLKSLALLLALSVVWHYMNILFTFIDGWIQKLRLHHKADSDNKLLQLLAPDHLASIFSWMMRLLELFLKILLIYAYLATVLSFFPWTRDLSTNLLSFVLQPAGKLLQEFFSFLPSLVVVIFLFTVIRYLGKFSDVVFINIARGELKFVGFEQEWAEPTRKIVKIVLYLLLSFLLLASLPIFNSPPSLIILVMFGITFSLSAVPSMKNVLSSVMLNYTGSFRKGDQIAIGNVRGEVVSKGLLVTKIRNRKNEVVILPNRDVIGSKIINYTESVQKNGHLSVEVPFYLFRHVKIEEIREKVAEATLGTDGIMLDPKPVLRRIADRNGKYGYLVKANTGQARDIEAIASRMEQHIRERLLADNIN